MTAPSITAKWPGSSALPAQLLRIVAAFLFMQFGDGQAARVSGGHHAGRGYRSSRVAGLGLPASSKRWRSPAGAAGPVHAARRFHPRGRKWRRVFHGPRTAGLLAVSIRGAPAIRFCSHLALFLPPRARGVGAWMPSAGGKPLGPLHCRGPLARAVSGLAWPTMLQNSSLGSRAWWNHALVGHFVAYAATPPSRRASRSSSSSLFRDIGVSADGCAGGPLRGGQRTREVKPHRLSGLPCRGGDVGIAARPAGVGAGAVRCYAGERRARRATEALPFSVSVSWAASGCCSFSWWRGLAGGGDARTPLASVSSSPL